MNTVVVLSRIGIFDNFDNKFILEEMLDVASRSLLNLVSVYGVKVRVA